MKVIVTTSLGMDGHLVQKAKRLAEDLGIVYCERRKQAVKVLLKQADAVLVVYKDRLVFEQKEGGKLFFHPDTAMLRMKAERDPFLEMVGSQPKKVLDATLGLGTDSLVLASAGHQVVGLESSFWTHFLVQEGLKNYQTGHAAVDQAMRSIETICTDSLSFLQNAAAKSVDIIYFDPMFSEEIKESHNLSGLEKLANPSPLSHQLVNEAKRVAREKIILKAHFRDRAFEDFGFIRHVRPNQKFHFGEIILEKEK
ncbi:class I SAM-dependent methyltransferase [Streptococcus suis]|uniref:SAM-dependent methyltransferase n=1 Tax=Streptococcus suis TaxID=1307 RepID=A0A4T2GT89_STRSU|nr:class I SAM-dependent methyltransferase [Streptococcus suis]MBM7268982.1 class I SAM-dependent methyltransferase [Streptococcus suis]MBM7269304.1 class I SAM-dependent methyltransferase [Streptococcus suis]TII00084.1 SAM-dependent methyltransferase [Streptococcus suis]TII01021.1 SAM-dependent methyltransferase [Streptococcus suis]